LALAIIVYLIVFYLLNGSLNNHVPFYEQMNCKSLGNRTLDQGSFDEMLWHYEETCTDDISNDPAFDKCHFTRKVLSLTLVTWFKMSRKSGYPRKQSVFKCEQCNFTSKKTHILFYMSKKNTILNCKDGWILCTYF